MLIQTGTHCTQHPGQLLHAHEFVKCSCRDCTRCVIVGPALRPAGISKLNHAPPCKRSSPGGTFSPLSYPQE